MNTSGLSRGASSSVDLTIPTLRKSLRNSRIQSCNIWHCLEFNLIELPIPATISSRFIQVGKAYADNMPKDAMGEQRGKGIPSACRDMSIEDSLAQLEKMKAGSGLEWCIRAKISVDDPVKCLRDPVIYRCNLQPHHRTGTTWKIYPTYDFCAPFLDSFEGVTHALRTNEYQIGICSIPGLRKLLAFSTVASGISPVSILSQLCSQSGSLPSWLIMVLSGTGTILECPPYAV